jgi:cyclopropane-fatty-acyl-phospholipid synthase
MLNLVERGLKNVDVVTDNVADFDTDQRFDRVVPVEMFENVRNYERLMARIASWLDNASFTSAGSVSSATG